MTHEPVSLGGFTPPERTLPDVLAATVAANPDAVALDDGTTRLTYREVWRTVADLSTRLRSMGIGVNDRVGIRMSSGTTDPYLAILGVLAAGAAFVPSDADDPCERAETVWREAGVCAVLQDGPALTFRPEVPPRGERRTVTPDDDAWIIFASGTTGTPKGATVTHRCATAFVDAEARLFCQDSPLGPGDRVLAGLSVTFDAWCEEMWLAWRHGACLIPAPRSSMRTGPALVEWLARRQITVVSTVPATAARWPTDQLPDLRLLILGGEACPAALADRLAKRCAEVWNVCGPTQARVLMTAARMSTGQPVTIGPPLQGWQVAVVDPQTGEPVSSAAEGFHVTPAAGTQKVEAGTATVSGIATGTGKRTGTGTRSGTGTPADRLRMAARGGAPFLVFLLSISLTMAGLVCGVGWISSADGWVATSLRSTVFAVGTLVALPSVPIAAKWILIGRWKPQEFEVCRLAHRRFKLMKSLIRTSPLVRFAAVRPLPASARSPHRTARRHPVRDSPGVQGPADHRPAGRRPTTG